MSDDLASIILNVDDTASSRLISTAILQQAGFEVVQAACGADALALVQKLPHLVLLDVNLPDINGFEVCRQIKTDPRTAMIPVVHLSASFVTAEDRVTGLDEGADGYLTQPVEPRELVATVNAFLRLKRAEQALRESEKWHRALFEHSHDALLTLSQPDWRFTSGNPAALAMFGLPRTSEFPSRTLWDCSPERQPDGQASKKKALEQFEHAMQAGSHRFDWTCSRAAGETFPASVVLTKIDSEGKGILLVTLRDESERKRLEASVAQSERLASMGMLAASMAHELNNPLAYVHYCAESLAEDLQVLAPAVQRCCSALRERVGASAFIEIAGTAAPLLEPAMLSDAVDRAREALHGTCRMKGMTRGLGMFSRVEAVEKVRVDVHLAVESALRLASNELKQRARVVKRYGDFPKIWASEGKLTQVFVNLLVNAAHAIEEGNVDVNQIAIRTWVEGTRACVEIADTGKGIPSENIESIFEPFFTTKSVGCGTGLGLAICRSIITELGGEIDAISQLGHGSRFVVRLPIHPSEPAEKPATIVSDFPRDSAPIRGRVLVVDDEELLRLSMKRLFGNNHEVVAVSSGDAARELLEQDPAFDVIVCDLMMSGMSGMELHAWLTARDPWLAQQVIFVTGGAFTPRASEYLARVDNLTLEKPVDTNQLKRVVFQRLRAAKKSTISET